MTPTTDHEPAPRSEYALSSLDTGECPRVTLPYPVEEFSDPLVTGWSDRVFGLWNMEDEDCESA